MTEGLVKSVEAVANFDTREVANKTISLILPCFNEEENIEFAYNTIVESWVKNGLEQNYNYEIVFVDDGSKDNTFIEIQKISSINQNVKCIQLSRNFGKEIGVSAGFANCTGDAAIILDVDMQYPVDKLSEFITKWEAGIDVVVGIRDLKQTNNLVEKIGSYFFYKIMNSISEVKIISGALDFRLIDRQVIDQFNKFTERGRTARVLIDWLGFSRDYVYYQEKPRLYGTATYSFLKRVNLALDSFISYSFFPLKATATLGVLIVSFTLPLGIIIGINKYFLNDLFNWKVTGSFYAGILNVFLTGIILIALGLIANYIATIQNEVINRPLYTIKLPRKPRKSSKSSIIKNMNN